MLFIRAGDYAVVYLKIFTLVSWARHGFKLFTDLALFFDWVALSCPMTKGLVGYIHMKIPSFLPPF